MHEVLFGGAEKVAIEEVRALNAIGHEAVLIVLRRTESTAFKDHLVGSKQIFFSDLLPWPLRLSFRIPLFRFFSLFHVTYAIFGRFVSIPEKLDAIIAHGTYTCFSGIAIARQKKIPLLALIWDPVVYILNKSYFSTQAKRASLLGSLAFAIGQIIDKWICRNSAAVLTGSKFHASKLRTLVRSPEKVKLIIPGVRLRQSVRSDRKDYAMLATSWKEGKEPEYVLELAQRLRQIKFMVAGAWVTEGFKRRFLSELAERGVEDRVSVIGAVDELRLLDLYSQAVVFLQIKADVGFGLPALEAASQGCTFIIPEGQGVCDIFASGSDGLMVSEKDTPQIAKYLENLFQNRATAIQMGKSAWMKAHSYSWARHAQELVEICDTYRAKPSERGPVDD